MAVTTATLREANIGVLPAPELLSGILLDVLSELPWSGEPRWAFDGVTWKELATNSRLYVTNSGCDVEDFDESPRNCTETRHQRPFQIYDVLEMGTANWIALGDQDELMADHFRRLLSVTFAYELVTGAGSGEMSLSFSAVAPIGTAFGSLPLPLWNALVVLEEELAIRMPNQRGMIHLPAHLLGLVVDGYGVHWTGTRWETPLGHIVVPDAGYVGAREPVAGGSPASGSGEAWLYASGPVHYKVTEPEFNGAEFAEAAFSFSTNDLARWRNAIGILVFEHSLVTAVLASVETEG